MAPLDIQGLPEIHLIDNTTYFVNKWLDLVFQINTDFRWGLRTGEIFVKLLIEEILKNNLKSTLQSSFLDARISRAIVFIQANYHKNITIAQIASEISLKTVRFRNCFHKAMGVTPKVYLTNLRLNHACKLLINKNNSIKEISNIVGFKKHNYFHKCFKEHFDTTPQKFRQNKNNYF